MANISYEIKKSIGILAENEKGYTKELNLISWDGSNAKLDIREWHTQHERCGKGITLTEEEGRKLMKILDELYREMDEIY